MPGLQWVLKPRSVVTPTGSIKLASHGWSALLALLNHTPNPPRVSLPPPRQSPQRPLAHYNARSQLGQKEIIWVMNRITQPLDRRRYPIAPLLKLKHRHTERPYLSFMELLFDMDTYVVWKKNPENTVRFPVLNC